MLTPAVLGYFERLHQHVLAQANDIQPTFRRLTETSVVGSPADQDFKTVDRSTRNDDRRRLWSQIQLNCLHMAVNVADHVRSLAMLLARPDVGVPIYAHATLARVAIEAATNVAYVHDSSCAFELRFARGIALLIRDLDMARRTANKVPGNSYMPSPGPTATQGYKNLVALVKRAKIEIILNKIGEPKAVRLSANAPEALINVKMTDLVDARYPNMPAVYGITSGVAHGMPHRLDDNALIVDRRGQWDPDPLDVGGSVLAAMNAAHTTLAAHAWHRGLEDDPSVAGARERVAAVDAEMQRFGRSHLRLSRPEPVARFLSQSRQSM